MVKKRKPVWKRKSPVKKGKIIHTMSTQQKSAAKARAKRAGRPYPNLVDNMAVIRRSRKK